MSQRLSLSVRTRLESCWTASILTIRENQSVCVNASILIMKIRLVLFFLFCLVFLYFLWTPLWQHSALLVAIHMPKQCIHYAVRSESLCALRGYGTLQRGGYAVVCQYRSCRWSVLLLCDNSLYSVVEQRLKCNTGEVFNCLIRFLLTRPPPRSSGQEFLAADPEVQDSIPGATRFSE
jgi:hypothetical protein